MYLNFRKNSFCYSVNNQKIAPPEANSEDQGRLELSNWASSLNKVIIIIIIIIIIIRPCIHAISCELKSVRLGKILSEIW